MSNSEVDAGILRAISLARLSPSSHNCQPWEIAFIQSLDCCSQIEQFLAKYTTNFFSGLQTERYLILALNTKRWIMTLPAHKMEMILSCGAFLESLLIALNSQHLNGQPCWYSTIIDSNTLSPYITLPATWRPLTIIAVSRSLDEANYTVNQQKIEFFLKRVTNRGPYQNTQITSDIIQRLANSKTYLFSDVYEEYDITFITNSQQIKNIGKFIHNHSHREFTHVDAWKETYKFLHFGRQAIQTAEDGIPITQVFGSLSPISQEIFKFFLSPSAMQLLKYLGFPKLISSQLATLFATAPCLTYFNFKATKPSIKTQLGAGAMWFSFCISATSFGLAVHPMSVILQHPSIGQEFQAEYNLPAGKGFLFCRVGYPKVSFSSAPKRKSLDICYV